MEELLEIIESVKLNFGKHKKAYLLSIRAIVSLLSFLWIFSFNSYIDSFAFLFSGITKYIYLSILVLICTFVPLPYAYFLMAVNIFLQTSSHIAFALIILFLLMMIILTYVRIVEEEGILLLITIIGLVLNVPYVAPIIAGIYFSASSIVALISGVIIYGFLQCFKEYLMYISTNADFAQAGLDSILFNFDFMAMYFKDNMYIISYSILFTGSVIINKVVESLKINYDKYICVALSSGFFLIGYFILLITFGMNVGIIMFLIGLIISLIISIIVVFFDTILDYQSVKYVKFEDGENMYYVKVIPKMYIEE